MEKKILIAVDGSPFCHRAVDYVGLMEGAMIRELTVTLYYVMSPIPPTLRQEALGDQRAFLRLRQMEKRNLAQAGQVLDTARQRLLERGFAEKQIDLKAHPRVSDTARDILFEAEQGLYDAVVLGRRGLSKTQELFLGSVTNQVVQHADRTPVWVVGGRVTSLKVLCAVDNSEGSLKAVDHLGFMLGENPNCRVTLLHVGPSAAAFCPVGAAQDAGQQLGGDQAESGEAGMHDFYAQALKVLAEAGLGRDQVEVRHRPGVLGVVRSILEEVRVGDYGTIVLGRHGENKSFFLGHVSDRVLSRGEEMAVWVVG